MYLWKQARNVGPQVVDYYMYTLLVVQFSLYFTTLYLETTLDYKTA